MAKKDNTLLEYVDNDIETLEGLQHIRHRPAMWGCNQATKQGVFLIVKEILDNSVDEARADPFTKHVIKMCFIKTKSGFQIVIRDSGRGVPLSKIEPIFTIPGTSGKWKDAYDASGGTHGVGAKATTAMSKSFVAVSSRNGEGFASLVVQDTVVTHLKKTLTTNPKLETGTTVFFEPDGELLAAVEEFFDPGGAYEDIRALMDFISVFVPNISFEISEGLEVIDVESLKTTPAKAWQFLNNIPTTNVVSTETTMTPQEYMLKRNGVSANVIWDSGYVKERDISVATSISQQKKQFKTSATNSMSYEVGLLLTHDFALRATSVLGAVNMININDKTSAHLATVYKVVKETLEPFVPEKFKGFFEEYYNVPVHVISNVGWQHAEFTGQDKNRFTDPDFAIGLHKALMARFESMDNSTWELLYNIIAEDIIVKYKRKHQLDLDLAKSDKNLAFDLNNVDSYYSCRSSDKNITELIICEGASAGGYAKQLRNVDTQAIFTLRGKPINALQMSFRDAVRNDIFKDLLQVLGTSPDDENLDNMRFGKVIILTDADADGYHITALLIGILHTINPKLLYGGKVLIASPPLYVVKTRNHAMFVRDNRSLLDLKVEAYSAVIAVTLKVESKQAYPLVGDQFRYFCYMIEHINEVLENTANKLNIEPGTLEQLTHCVGEIKNNDTVAIAKKLGLDECTYEKIANSLLFNIGDVETVIPLNGLIAELEQYVIPEFVAIHYTMINFIVSTLHTKEYVNEMLSIVEIGNIFKTINKQFGISRMKGLGQMDKKHLTSTCLDPATRTYMVVKSPGDVKRIFDLLGVDTASRKLLVNKNVNT